MTEPEEDTPVYEETCSALLIDPRLVCASFDEEYRALALLGPQPDPNPPTVQIPPAYLTPPEGSR